MLWLVVNFALIFPFYEFFQSEVLLFSWIWEVLVITSCFPHPVPLGTCYEGTLARPFSPSPLCVFSYFPYLCPFPMSLGRVFSPALHPCYWDLYLSSYTFLIFVPSHCRICILLTLVGSYFKLSCMFPVKVFFENIYEFILFHTEPLTWVWLIEVVWFCCFFSVAFEPLGQVHLFLYEFIFSGTLAISSVDGSLDSQTKLRHQFVPLRVFSDNRRHHALAGKVGRERKGCVGLCSCVYLYLTAPLPSPLEHTILVLLLELNRQESAASSGGKGSIST